MRRLFLFFLMSTLVSGCGGGSGSSGGNSTALYTGNGNQATVTASNARAVSVEALHGVQGTSTIDIFAKKTGKDPSLIDLLQVADIGERLLTGALSKTTAKTVADTISSSGSQPGYSGFASYTTNFDRSTGVCSGSTTFNSYQEQAGGPKLSGNVSFNGTIDNMGNFARLDLFLKDLAETTDTQSLSLNGTMSLRHSGSTTTVAMNVIKLNAATSRTYWFKNFSMTTTGSTTTMTGTYFDHDYGYVTVSTDLPLTASSVTDPPTSGRLLFSGSGGTKARLTYNATGYILEVDTSGTNVFVPVM